MWQEILACMGERRNALCIPWQGEAVPLVAWYGILAAVGIFLGAWYASKHMESENDNPDIIWDALLIALIPAVIGARLWYVLQDILAYGRSYTFLQLINTRTGGLNIFGGILFGLIAVLIYARIRKIDGWLLADAGLMGLLIGQGIGRIGNFVNEELYGPPTGSSWYGMLVSEQWRTGIWRDMTTYPYETTRFHPTMFYEMAWLFLTFGVLYYLFRRYQDRIVHGMVSGAYLIMAGIGRFIVEFWRMDQPQLVSLPLSSSQLVAVVYVALGLIILLDRMGHLKIPFIARPQTARQRSQAFQEIERERRRLARSRERERAREKRRKERARVQKASSSEQTNDSG